MAGELHFGADLAGLLAKGANAKDATIAFGEQSVSGASALNIDTGLSTIHAAIAIKKEATAPTGAGDAGLITVDYGADGLLDVYGWQDDFTAASEDPYTVIWAAIGKR